MGTALHPPVVKAQVRRDMSYQRPTRSGAHRAHLLSWLAACLAVTVIEASKRYGLLATAVAGGAGGVVLEVPSR